MTTWGATCAGDPRRPADTRSPEALPAALSVSGSDQHFHPPILLPAGLVGLSALRPRLPEGAHADPGCGNALGHHGRSHRFRATRAELLVIWRGAARVRVAVEPDLVVRVVLHVLHELVDLGHLRRPHVALVEVEQDVAERRPLLRGTGGGGAAGGGGAVGGARRGRQAQPVRRHEDLSAGPRSRLRAARSARALRKPRVLALRLPVSSSCVPRFEGELRRNSSLSPTEARVLRETIHILIGRWEHVL